MIKFTHLNVQFNNFNKFTKLSNHHHKSVAVYFHHPNKILNAYLLFILFHSLPQATINLFSVPIGLSFMDIPDIESYSMWFLVSSSFYLAYFFQILPCCWYFTPLIIDFLLILSKYVILFNSFTCSSFARHLGCFQVWGYYK